MLNLPSFPICTHYILPDFCPTMSVDANYIHPSSYKVLKFCNTPMKAISTEINCTVMAVKGSDKKISLIKNKC